MTQHSMRYPNESANYRAARNELLTAEVELRAKVEEVASLRRSLPLGGVIENYVFDTSQGSLPISELFVGNKQTLILYSYMFGAKDKNPCPMCSAFMDSANGVARHLEQKVNFAVVARRPLPDFAALAQSRGWDQIKLLSAANNHYAQDFHTEGVDGDQRPLCNVFVKRDKVIRHFWSSELMFAPSDWHPRHVDMLYPLWNFLDITPEGRGDFFPKIEY